MANTSAERDILLHSWQQLESAAIVKDVATKGKFINLAIAFLAKRHASSADEARDFFRREIDAYVRRLLTNGQVYRAELVLKNLGRPVKYVMYEFLVATDASSAAVEPSFSPPTAVMSSSVSSSSSSASSASYSSLPVGSSSSDIIMNYLLKTDTSFAVDRVEYDRYLAALRALRGDRQLSKKYAHQLRDYSLDELYQKDATFRNEMLCDVVFETADGVTIASRGGGLDKHIVWTYLLSGKRYELIVRWLHAMFKHEPFEVPHQEDLQLDVIFKDWSLDERMLQELQDIGAGEAIRECLCRGGYFLKDEREHFSRQLRRICRTESWDRNANLLELNETKAALVRLILQHGFIGFLIHDLVDITAMLALRETFPKQRHIIDFCVALRSETPSQPSSVSALVSAHLLKSNPTFHKQQPLIYLTELLLRNPNLADVLDSCSAAATAQHADPTILAQIPLLRVLLDKHRTATRRNDQTTSAAELVKRFAKIDLRQIHQEAAGLAVVDGAAATTTPPLSFDNAALTAKYGAPERLGYLFYVKQSRSAFAVFAFAVEQLQLYAQISRGQIAYACSRVTELALAAPPDNGELGTHCVAFMEMLGVNTSSLRAYLRCVRVWRDAERAGRVAPRADGRAFGELSDAQRLEALIEAQTGADDAEQSGRDLDALRMVCEAHAVPFPVVFLQRAAGTMNWLQWLAFASYYDYPLETVLDVLLAPKTAVDMLQMNETMRTNLRTAVMYDLRERKSPTSSRSGQIAAHRELRPKKTMVQQTTVAGLRTSGETISSSISSLDNGTRAKLDPSKFLKQHNDLFAIILRCAVATSQTTTNAATENPLTLRKCLAMFHPAKPPSIPDEHLSNATLFQNLLHSAVALKWPFLAVLAATASLTKTSEDQQFCWYIWLALSTEAAVPATTDDSSFATLVTSLVTHSLRSNCLQTLHQSMLIFYPSHAFRHFAEYIHRTGTLDFSADVTRVLHDFLLALNRNATEAPFAGHDDLLAFCIRLLLDHLQHGFQSDEHRQLLLSSLCASGISDHTAIVDFCVLQRLYTICAFTACTVDVEQLRRDRRSDAQIQTEYERLRERLVGEREFAKALELADALQLPRDSIIYESWMAEYEQHGDGFDLGRCEREIDAYSLAPELVITFYTQVAHGLPYENGTKYAVLKRIMDVIKRHRLFPSENFNCDRIEYDMVMSYVRGPATIGIDQLDVYYSDYFETIMRHERGVLYKSFGELKEISGIEDLTVSNKRRLTAAESTKLDALIYRLLDDGDIVQALRLQAIFLHRPLDLHYLVFCMALAEGLASLSDLSPEQEQMSRDARKFAMSRFNRRRPFRTNSQSSTSSSPLRATATLNSTSASNVALEFEEIPTRAKQDILDALQNFAARMSHGARIAKRIVHTWRAAMYLDKEYLDVLRTKDAYVLLESAIADDCIYKLDVMQDIMESMSLQRQECADFLADKIATSIIRAQFYILQSPVAGVAAAAAPAALVGGAHTLWGYDLEREFRLFLDLCSAAGNGTESNSNGAGTAVLLGNAMLQHCDALRVYRRYDAAKCATPEAEEPSAAVRTIYRRLRDQTLQQRVLSHKKQNTITVELLIKAHDCFVHECNMEGIACVLHRTRAMCTVLTTAKSWSLIVRMLMGIGRYREMYYCFETLIRHEQFESLLGQFDADRIRGLNQACISYLRECVSAETTNEYFRLAALHFRMYKEIAQMWEHEAKAIVQRLLEGGAQQRGDAIASSGGGGGGGAGAARGGSGDIPATSAEAASAEDAVECVPFLLKCTADVAAQLQTAMEGYAHATENYLIDNKLALAQQTASMAELVALQIYLVQSALKRHSQNASSPSASPTTSTTTATAARALAANAPTCICVVNVPSAAVLRHFVNHTALSVSQALILSRTYAYELNWTDALYVQYILRGNERYLQDYCDRMQLTEPMIEAMVRQFQHQRDVTARMESAIGRLVELVETVTTRYRLASVLGLKRCVAALINDHSLYYLKDTNYGRCDGWNNGGGNVSNGSK